MFLVVVGSEGRGTWSKNIATVGGLLWLTSVIIAFVSLGIKNGVFFLLGSFVLGAILTNILKPLLNPHGH